jgi:hypothetical protein
LSCLEPSYITVIKCRAFALLEHGESSKLRKRRERERERDRGKTRKSKVRPANNSHRSLKIFPRNTKGIVPVSLSPRVTSFHSAGFLFLLVPGCRLHGRITELLSCQPPESKGCLALTFSAKLPQAGRRRERERKKAAPCIRRVRSRLFLGAEVLLRRDGNSDWAYSTSVLSGDKGAGVISPGQGVLRGVSPYKADTPTRASLVPNSGVTHYCQQFVD